MKNPTQQILPDFMPFRLFWGSVLCIVAARLAIIILSPLELGVDEAQYWLWGQNLDFGYYSKPPLIGWLLGLSDALFGSSAAGTRVFAPFLHLCTALILYHAAKIIAGKSAGQITCLLWLTLPSVALASFVISTDSLLLVFWSLGLFFVLRAKQAEKLDPKWMFAAGLSIGVALLAKYAAIYFVIGLIGWLATRRLWQLSPSSIADDLKIGGIFIFGAAIGAAPTWMWNVMNGLVTVKHLGQNANLDKPAYSFASLFDFIIAQMAVIGPICFILLVLCLLTQKRAAQISSQRAFLYWFILPPLMIISTQAFLKEANANWAVTAYPAALIVISIIAALFQPWQRYVSWAIGVNLLISVALGVVFATGSFGIFTPDSDPLRRLRGWAELAEEVHQTAQQHDLRTIVAHNRASAALLHWHLAGQNYDIVVIPNPASPANHYERSYPLTAASARPLLALTDREKRPFGAQKSALPIGHSEIQISANKTRYVDFWKVD